MSLRREPSTPPRIPGYSYSRLLGTGGFADVFLYQQQMPHRQVAVKVLLASSFGDDVRERFRTEADLMAKLSHHPSIVTIYQADVAPDGRPYLVMEYCSQPGLGQRYRTERMTVAEVLRIGVRLASAVETAHRAGVLHRDIKPANVLVTDFGWPALTDFGIAATTGWSSGGAAVGMSIPWSPPELLAEHPIGDVRADVYSLAATVYSLLARRSPFEVPDGSNTAADLLARIERVPLRPTGRGDVPESLQAVLSRAMDKSPDRRYPTALAFARALQQVEAELLLPLTPLDLPQDVLEPSAPGAVGTGGTPGADEGVDAEIDGEPDNPVDDRPTRLRPVQSVAPDPVELHQHDQVPHEWRRQAEGMAAGVGPHVPTARDRRRRVGRTVAGAVAGLVVVGALVVAGVLALRPGTTPDETDRADVSAGPNPSPGPVPAVRAVPSPTDLVGSLAADGSAEFGWTNPDPQEGDAYLWGVAVPGSEPVLTRIAEPSVTIQPDPSQPAAQPGAPVCIEVSIVRADGRYSTTPAVGCTEG